MVSNEIIGIIILSSVAGVIVILYFCKCFSDCMHSRHKENVKPATLTDQDIMLLSVESSNDPMPYDPYNMTNELSSKNHDDLEMVAMSIEQFARKESYRKSVRKQSNPKCNTRKCAPRSRVIEIEKVSADVQDISDVTVEIDARIHGKPMTFGSKRKETIDAPVIVHNSQPIYDKVADEPHIYAAVQKSQPPAPDPSQFDAPTYFRPVKHVNPIPVVPPKPSVVDPEPEPSMHIQPVERSMTPPLRHIEPTVERNMAAPLRHIEPTVERNMAPQTPQKPRKQETASYNGHTGIQTPVQVPPQEEVPIKRIKVPKSNPKKQAPKTSENIPPNEQDVAKENSLFFIPDTVVSPKTTRKSRRTSERTIVTLDDIESVTRDRPKTPKTAKKSKKGGTKTDDMGTPKTPKRRKKSFAEGEGMKPVKLPSDDSSDSSSLRTDTVKNNPYSGLQNPQIPPKPIVNPLLLSPKLQVRSSQL